MYIAVMSFSAQFLHYFFFKAELGSLSTGGATDDDETGISALQSQIDPPYVDKI